MDPFQRLRFGRAYLIGALLGVFGSLWMFAPEATAQACAALHNDQNSFYNACQTHAMLCEPDPNGNQGCEDGRGACEWDGEMVPSCWIRYFDTGLTDHHGFTGSCPSEGTEGPNVQWTGSIGEPRPDDYCSGPCRVENSGGCTEYEIQGVIVRICETAHTGETCIPDGPDDGEEPQECNTGFAVGGDCVTFSDSNQTPPAPEVCIGPICNEVPPNPAFQPDCASGAGGAVCVGAPGASQPPRPPSPPFPPSQQPALSSSASSAAGNAPVYLYGPPQGSNAGPPDPNGNCPPGSTPDGNACTCAPGTSYNGQFCEDDDFEETCPADQPDCVDDGDGRSAGRGTCGSSPPHCTGDAIDCSVVYQTWVTRCALEESSRERRPVIDLNSDPFEQYGGAGALFDEIEIGEGGPAGLNTSGFLPSGCPLPPTIPPVMGHSFQLPAVWCELGFVQYIMLAIGLIIASRIVASGD